MRRLVILLWAALMCVGPLPVVAQTAPETLTITTVTRPPFSMLEDGRDVGFSIDLLNAVAQELNLDVTYQRVDGFGDMLQAVRDAQSDGAIANISITAERERQMDFSQPIFDSGIQVMVPQGAGSANTILSALLTREIGLAVLGALALLFGGGMLMWLFERKRQPYFDRPAKEAAFPAFWWALNLVVNGGFEERVPQSRPGRAFAIVLVISSLFIVSIFVAQITAALTISAIQDNVDNINDLDGRRVATIEGSTSSDFLDQRGVSHLRFPGLAEMLDAFEAERLDAVVFDGPILAYYAQTTGAGQAQLLDRVYRPETYGMAFPSGSPLRERFDQVLLELRENGSYQALLTKWFGSTYQR